MKNYTLSGCVVIRNEQDYIEGCLNRLYWLCDEIVIIDTNSTDNTHKVVEDWIKKYNVADRVIFEKVGNKFHDQNDLFSFGPAKTYAFSRATKDYVIWQDGSDLVEKPKELKKLFQEVTAKSHPVSFIIPTSIAENTSFPRVRITPRVGALMVGECHEVMRRDPKWKRCFVKSVITNRRNAISLDRNLKILLKDWNVNNNKSRRNAFYLGNTYYGLQDLENALKWFKYRAFDFKDKDYFKEETFKSAEMVADLTLILSRSGKANLEDVPGIANSMIKYFPERYEGYYYKGMYFMEKLDWEKALKCLNQFDKCKVPKNVVLWLNPQIYKNAAYIMQIQKCETNLKYKGVLQPDEIIDGSQFNINTGQRRNSGTYTPGTTSGIY